MTEHCLYGVRVHCQQALFANHSARGGDAPGEHPPVSLEPAPPRIHPETYPEVVPLHTNHGREVTLHTDRPLAASVAGQSWCLEVEHIVRFTWTGGVPVVHYQEGEQGNWPLTAFWFIHIFLPMYLTLERGYDFIHCAAVEIDQRLVLFIAPSTGGKSTLADYCLQQGHPLLTDDKAGTFFHEGSFHAAPSHPHHRPFRQFEVLGHAVDNFASAARPIHAFYLLEQAEPNDPVEITEIQGFRKFEELMPNYLYAFRFLQERRMRWLAALADQTRVYRLRRPWNLGRQDEVYRALSDHARQSTVLDRGMKMNTG